MHKGSVVAIQSSTYNTRTFDLIFQRLDKVFPNIIGYHTGASSIFCGFFLASFAPIKQRRPLPELKYLSPELINRMLGLPIIDLGGTRKKGRWRPRLGDSNEAASAAEKKFFGPDVVVPESTGTGSMFKNPLIIVGAVVAFALPLILTRLG